MSSKTKAALIVVTAFVAGLFVGVAGDRFALYRTGRLFPRRVPGHLAAYLTHELKLNDHQRVQIETIVNDHRTKIDAAYKNVQPQMRKEIDAANAEIEAVLTPDQRTKFRAMRERVEKSRRGRPRL